MFLIGGTQLYACSLLQLVFISWMWSLLLLLLLWSVCVYYVQYLGE